MAFHQNILFPGPLITGSGVLSGLETEAPKMADMGFVGALGAILQPNEEVRQGKVICLKHAI